MALRISVVTAQKQRFITNITPFATMAAWRNVAHRNDGKRQFDDEEQA